MSYRERENRQSETRACRCRLDAVVPGFLLPTPQVDSGDTAREMGGKLRLEGSASRIESTAGPLYTVEPGC